MGQRSKDTSQMGIMRMVSAIEVKWVSKLLPKLKNEVDVDALSGIKPKEKCDSHTGYRNIEETKESSSVVIGKKQA